MTEILFPLVLMIMVWIGLGEFLKTPEEKLIRKGIKEIAIIKQRCRKGGVLPILSIELENHLSRLETVLKTYRKEHAFVLENLVRFNASDIRKKIDQISYEYLTAKNSDRLMDFDRHLELVIETARKLEELEEDKGLFKGKIEWILSNLEHLKVQLESLKEPDPARELLQESLKGIEKEMLTIEGVLENLGVTGIS